MSQFSIAAKPEFVAGRLSNLRPHQWSPVGFSELEQVPG